MSLWYADIMCALRPYLALYRCYCGQIVLGMMIAIITLLASIVLLALSGWFIASSALAGAAGIYSFNYMLPAAGVRYASITRTAGRWAERVISHDATFRILQQLRLDIFRRIIPLSPGAMAFFRQVDLLDRLVTDVDILDHLYLRILSPLVGALFVIIIANAGLCLLDTRLGVTLGTVMLLILALMPPIFYSVGQPVGEELNALRADYRLQLNTWLIFNAELTLYGAANSYRCRLDATEKRWQQYQRRQEDLITGAQCILTVLTGIILTLVIWVLAEGRDGNSQPGALIALFLFATMAALEALGPVTSAFQHLGQIIASAMRISSIIQQSPAVTFPNEGQGPALATSVVLRVSEVGFCYPKQATPALDGLSLTVDAGEHIAILGHTGSGKSTLLQLLTRAWDPQTGKITLNGIPLQQWSEQTLRAMTAVVPQRVHIFSATLRDNLSLAKSYVDDAKLYMVLQQVGLERLLEVEGLNSWLGEGGRQLSGGEQRRIGIARALLQFAPLWLLDEPTEGLDAVNEQQILNLLIKLDKSCTVIIVTHRLQGLEQLDRIYIMERGTVIEQGSHQDLIAKNGRYYHYYQQIRC